MAVAPKQHTLIGVEILKPLDQTHRTVCPPEMVVFSRPVKPFDGDPRLTRTVDPTLEQLDIPVCVIPPVSDNGIDPGLVSPRDDVAHRRGPSSNLGPDATGILPDERAVHHQDQTDPRFSQAVTDIGHPLPEYVTTGVQRLVSGNQFVRRPRGPVAVLLVTKMIVVRHVRIRIDCISRRHCPAPATSRCCLSVAPTNLSTC
ncbi:MAG: hypothetical protein CMJ69_12340 [Planctomycetaceae bacterium]|nr:hypothetical protein [Planctomycetaceae bacterium]